MDRRANVFSQGKFFVTNATTGEKIPDDPLTKLIQNPNPQQAQTEFLYNHLVYKSLGNNYINVKSNTNPNNIDDVIALFNLNQDYIDFENIDDQQSFVFAQSDVEAFNNLTISYDIFDKSIPIRIGNLIIYNDLPNTLVDDCLIKGQSRVNSLLPTLSNISLNQEAKNVNLNFSRKFLMSNERQFESNNVPLEDDEKTEIEERLFQKDVIATKTAMKSLPLTNNFQQLMFDEMFAADMLKVGQAYAMNRHVLDYFKGNSFENEQIQESVAQWIQNDIDFEGKIFASTLENFFGYQALNRKVHMTFDHLPVMQFVEKQRAEVERTIAETNKINAETAALLQNLNINISEQEIRNLLKLNIDDTNT